MKRLSFYLEVVVIVSGYSFWTGTQQAFPQLVLVDTTLQELGEIADTATVETARCLYGFVRNDSSFIASVTVPEITYQDSVALKHAPCGRGALATWHNHLRFDDSARDRCYLSERDIAFVVRYGPAYTIVHVDINTWCWWNREQVIAAVTGRILWPLADQIYDGRN